MTKNDYNSVETQCIASLHWSVHPLWDFDYWKSVSLLLVFVGVIIIIKITFHSLGYVIVSAILLSIALSKYFFPTKYCFTDNYLLITHCGLNWKREWTYYKSYFVSKTGIFLSPFEHKSWLENFRGNYILFGRDNKDEVIRFVRAKIEKEQ